MATLQKLDDARRLRELVEFVLTLTVEHIMLTGNPPTVPWLLAQLGER